ncbi:MAG: CBS domain-containing protein [Chloroflexi bacterium]|nr:CBS domain-containing protein [Chloroflexota bacterium]
MEFTVRDWMNELVVFIDPKKTVSDALALMRRRYIHSLIINKTADNPEYGIITSTDICDKIIAQNRNPSHTRVEEIMNSPLLTVDQDARIQECAVFMQRHKIHHLPVTDENLKLVGMISDADFLIVAEAMGHDDGERIV